MIFNDLMATYKLPTSTHNAVTTRAEFLLCIQRVKARPLRNDLIKINTGFGLIRIPPFKWFKQHPSNI